MSQPITIPAESIDAVRLIIAEAKDALTSCAQDMEKRASASDFRLRTAAAMHVDHGRKLDWVLSLLKEPEEKMTYHQAAQ